jgi:hypothetical protein
VTPVPAPEVRFGAPWEARAFGTLVALLDAQGLTWEDFKPHLIAAVAAEPDRPYYEAFAAALEVFAQPWVDSPSPP